jgi:hypothetical protein
MAAADDLDEVVKQYHLTAVVITIDPDATYRRSCRT